MKQPRWTYDELVEGTTIELGSYAVTAEEIVAFATEFDPQPMHLDTAAGEASLLGGLSASGWHTSSIMMRMLCDGYLLDSSSQGAPGIDYCKWTRPVLAGDTLGGRTTVISRRLSSSRPNLGFVTMRATIGNQRGETVLEFENAIMFLTRAALT